MLWPVLVDSGCPIIVIDLLPTSQSIVTLTGARVCISTNQQSKNILKESLVTCCYKHKLRCFITSVLPQMRSVSSYSEQQLTQECLIIYRERERVSIGTPSEDRLHQSNTDLLPLLLIPDRTSTYTHTIYEHAYTAKRKKNTQELTHTYRM